MNTRERDRDQELLIPVADEEEVGSPPTVPIINLPLSSAHHLHHATGVEAFSKVIRSWASKKFMTGCVILFPIAMTFYITWWFIRFVDGFFFAYLCSSWNQCFRFIFLVGVFMSSWLGTSVLGLGEWFIKKMPLVCHIYSASKQISAAISPDQSSGAFKEVVILRHPRVGEYAVGFITSTIVLRSSIGDEKLSCVYVPTNHLYLGDIFLVNRSDVIRPNLSVREAIEILLSGGMSVPQVISIVDGMTVPGDHVRVVNSSDILKRFVSIEIVDQIAYAEINSDLHTE